MLHAYINGCPRKGHAGFFSLQSREGRLLWVHVSKQV